MKPILFFFLLSFWLLALPKDVVKSQINKTPDAQPLSHGENKTTINPANETIKLPIVYISDFEGRFINIDSEKTQLDYYNVLERLKYYQNILPIENKWESPITLNNGATFWPSISVKYILQQQKGADLVYSMLKESRFDVINVGKRDFYAPYDIMSNLSKNKQITTLPFLSSNSNCKQSKELPLCQFIKNKKYKIMHIHDMKIGILSVISPDVLEKSYYKNVKDMQINSPLEEANKIATYLKEKKEVDLVLLLAQIEENETSPQKTIKLAENTKNIDLIISNAQNTKLIKNYSNSTYILGSNPDRYEPNIVLLDIQKTSKDQYQIQKLTNISQEYKRKSFIPLSFKNILNNYKQNYLKEYDVPINNIQVKNINLDEYINFILKLMVHKTDTELAVINKANFNASLFPINKLTLDTLEKSIIYDNQVISFEMKGKLLKRFILKAHQQLAFTNVQVKANKDVIINGRAIIEDKTYSIATTDFLANGGDQFFTNAFFIKKKTKHQQLRVMFKAYMQQDKFKKDEYVFNSSTEFKDLSKEFIWEFHSNLGLYYIKNDLSNTAGYKKAKFDSTPAELLKLDGRLSLVGNSKYHIFDNKLELHYYQSNENNTSFIESDDSIIYTFNYKNNYFKTINANSPFAPLPYFETKLNSEITKPKEEKNHYYELFVSSGISFLSLNNKLELKLGYQGSKDFRSDEKIKSGFIFGYRLDNFTFKHLDIPLKINSTANYFINLEQNQVVDFLLTFNIPILGFFHFSSQFNAYTYKEKEKDWSYSYGLFFGVNIIYNEWF